MLVVPHEEITKKSKPVVDMIIQVEPLMKMMACLCNQKDTDGRTAYALAHCQVDRENPLTFFVMNNGDAIVNPKIIEGKGMVWSEEGCMSFLHKPSVKVQRFKRIKVEYWLINNKETRFVHKTIEGRFAMIIQHEIDHFNLKTIYDKEN